MKMHSPDGGSRARRRVSTEHLRKALGLGLVASMSRHEMAAETRAALTHHQATEPRHVSEPSRGPMTPDAQRARRLPGPLAENSATKIKPDSFADRPRCESHGCLSPAIGRLGLALCYEHLKITYRDLSIAQARRTRFPPGLPVGIGIFSRPAPRWLHPSPFTSAESMAAIGSPSPHDSAL